MDAPARLPGWLVEQRLRGTGRRGIGEPRGQRVAGDQLAPVGAFTHALLHRLGHDLLPGADVVVTTIGVGGRRAWEADVLIPRRFGIYLDTTDGEYFGAGNMLSSYPDPHWRAAVDSVEFIGAGDLAARVENAVLSVAVMESSNGRLTAGDLDGDGSPEVVAAAQKAIDNTRSMGMMQCLGDPHAQLSRLTRSRLLPSQPVG